uniref:Uncharacterized protein n=1 Tax=Hyaloperonospora arabidopsidis (strain Emoy2) TaxID=559515 RepID=M4C6E9_HYAAE
MNMRTRSRMVWAATWQTLSRHFTTIGCHEDLTVGMYAIDSLRQLSVKFLERAELRDFNFQRLFLAPFEVIMSNATSLETRELILRCVENLVLARVSNIRSGWKTIWGVLRVAAETYAPGSEDRVVLLGFQVARGVLERHFDSIVDVFVDAVECLLAFAVCGCEEVEHQMEERITLTQLGVDCVWLLRSVCIEKLATGGVIEPLTGRETAGSFSASSAPAAAAAMTKAVHLDCNKIRVVAEDPSDVNSCASVEYREQKVEVAMEKEKAELPPSEVLPPDLSMSSHYPGTDSEEMMEGKCFESSEAVYNGSAAHTRMWWPTLTALSALAADRRLDVRLAALEVLFDALEMHGKKFSPGLWKSIFKDILIPLLFELHHLEVFLEKGAHPLPKLPLPVPRNLSSQMPRYTASKTTATLCLERLLECFGLFYDILGFLPEVLFLLCKFMSAGDGEQQLATASANALETTLIRYGHKFPTRHWGLIVDELCNAMKRAEPTWIFSTSPPAHDAEMTSASEPDVGSSIENFAEQRALSSPAPSLLTAATNASSPHQPSLLGMYPGVVATLNFSFAASFPLTMVGVGEVEAQRVPSRSHLAVLLTLQRLAGNVLASRQSKKLSLSVGHARLLLSCLRESFIFARKVNDSSSLRRYLRHVGWRYGMTVPSSSELPSLLSQEVLGKQQYLRVLFATVNQSVNTSEVVPIGVEEAREYMARLVQDSVEEYLVWTGSAPRQVCENGTVPADVKQRVEGYTPLMVAILEELAGLGSPELERHMSWLYPLLTNLVMVPDVE